MSDAKPVGKVHVINAAARRKHSHAVFVCIMCEDDAGQPWHFETSCFNFELKPGHPLYTESAAVSAPESRSE